MHTLSVILVALALSSCGRDEVDRRAHQPTTPNLDTPQACLENFVISARADDWERARSSSRVAWASDGGPRPGRAVDDACSPA